MDPEEIEAHVRHWIDGAQIAWEVSDFLLSEGHIGFAGFFGHLAVEKTLKAVVTKQIGSEPPRIHNLVQLALLGKIDLTREQTALKFLMTRYCIEGRYPKISYPRLLAAELQPQLLKSKEFSQWLIQQY